MSIFTPRQQRLKIVALTSTSPHCRRTLGSYVPACGRCRDPGFWVGAVGSGPVLSGHGALPIENPYSGTSAF